MTAPGRAVDAAAADPRRGDLVDLLGFLPPLGPTGARDNGRSVIAGGTFASSISRDAEGACGALDADAIDDELVEPR